MDFTSQYYKKNKSILEAINNLEDFLININEKPFRKKQILEWIKKGILSFDSMTNLSKNLREKLKENFMESSVKLVKTLTSKLDNSKKLLFKTSDNLFVEIPILSKKDYQTICMSTQIGCPVGCLFCASGKFFKRNLKWFEMVEIFIIAKSLIKDLKKMVIMGMGEPLLNYDNTINFLKFINKELKFSSRNITLSTVGIVKNINKLAKEEIKPKLALSLHFPTDEERKKFIPNIKYSINDIMAACFQYWEETKRRLTIEYILFGKGLNSTPEHAGLLVKLLKYYKENVHVNLIPYNEIGNKTFTKPSDGTVRWFASILRKNGINVTIRNSQGVDISAACGQLAGKFNI